MTVSEKMIEAAARADAEFAGRTFDGLSGHEKTRYRERAKLMLEAALESDVRSSDIYRDALELILALRGYQGEDMGRVAGYRVAAEIAALGLSRSPDGLSQNVVDLVIAAREFWDTRNDLSEESDALDKALEAFASRVQYANEPAKEPTHG